jgi:uncharacterized protein YyaL (SSP411 family)
MNRLAHATSPYLQQHRDNPVHWFEWGEDAFDVARERDVPVFLSVGYSACHWCHVMAHESFEDEATAAYLNEHFVSIKVDREERPDIDAVYMEVTQAMTGQGGWPMTCILTPDATPFFAGTYYPREPRQGMPAFTQVLQAIVKAWGERRDEVVGIGADVVEHLHKEAAVQPADSDDIGAAAVTALARTFDERFAGFGGAPKFPPSMVCEFLLRRAARVGDDDALRMAERTLEAMARGGLYDQLGGGFARYSVDARWDVPHFEKMLYDNALLLRVYVHWLRQTANPLADRIARETADFMLRELRTAEHGFASALDADSEGVEGAFYVWTLDQFTDALGETDGAAAAALFGVSEEGNFEGGASTLRLDVDPADWGEFADLQRRLLDARNQRTRPARDDKVVAAWNGLAIAALAEAGMVLNEPRYTEMAESVGDLLVAVHYDDEDVLRRVSRDGVTGMPRAVLEDYACMADGFLALFGATGAAVWFERAASLVRQIEDKFSDGDGGFFDTASDAESLLKRPQDPADNATPSGQAMTASVLVSMAALTGDDHYRAVAERLFGTLSGLGERAPRFAGQSLAALEALIDGPRQVAVVGVEGDPGRDALAQAAFRLSRPGLVVAQGAPGAAPVVVLLRHRSLVGGRAAAYLCHDFVCDLPVTDPAELRDDVR